MSVYYFLRKIWFSAFPRKVGRYGYVATDKRLKAAAQLPAAPATWASPRLKWGMLGNGPGAGNPPADAEGVGDCAVAGPLHAIMAAAAFLKLPVPSFTPVEAIDAYFSMTGGADSGLNPPGVFEEWEAGTLPGAAKSVFGDGGPFVNLDPTNVEQLKSAIATFGWVGIGVNLQEAQETQFSKGQMWDYVSGSKTVGGHFVVLTGFDKKGVGPYTISWAKGFRSTWSFVTNLAVEAYTGVLSPHLQAGKYVLPLSDLDSYCSDLPGV